MKYILLFLLPGFLFSADFLVTVNSNDEIDYMWSILNAVAMMFSTDDFLDVLKLVFLFGSVVSFYSWITQANGDGAKTFTKYNLGVVAFLILVFSSTSNLYIKTNTYPLYYENNNTSPTMGTAISIPTTLAYSYAFFNSFGNVLTNLYVNTLNLTGNSYSIANGGYASSIRDSLNLMSHNPGDANFKYASNVESFFSDCVFVPFSAKGDDGITHIESIFNSKDIKGLITSWYANSEIVGGIPASSYSVEKNGENWFCADFWNKINNNDTIDYQANFQKIFKGMDDRDIGLITKSYGLPKSNFDEMAIQAGMIYAIKNNSKLPQGIAYAQGKNNAEFNMKNLSNGYYLSQMLPKLQSFFRAFLYALFPLIFAISLLPGGFSIVKNYGKSLIWIEMWGVSSAILNFFLIKYGESMVSGDFTVNNSYLMISESANIAGMAGYLYMLVPAISWGIMSGSFTSIGSIVSGLAQNANISSGALAGDAQKLALKENVNAETGKNFSYAEALHFQQIQGGLKSGIETGINMGNDFANKTRYDAQTPFNALSSKMATAGGLNNVYKEEAKKSGLDFAGLMGNNSLNTQNTMYNSSRANVRNLESNALMESKHGSNLTQNAFTRDNEALIKNLTRQGEIGSQAQRDSFAQMQATQDYLTQEKQNAFRNDLNGDGVVSRNEMNFEAGLNANQARIATADKFNTQEALKTQSLENKNSSNESIRSAQNANSTMFGDIAGASGTSKYFGGLTENSNMRKDTTQLQNQSQNGLKPEDMGFFGAVNNVKDFKHMNSESNTIANVFPELTKKMSEMDSQFQAKYGENANVAMFNAYGEKGIFKEDLTKSVIDKEISTINDNASQALNNGLNSYLASHSAGDATSQGLMKIYSSLNSSYEKALASGDSQKIEAIKKVMNSETMQPLKKLANDYMNSSEANSIRTHANSEINGVYSKFEEMGVIKRDGENTGYLDTQKTLEKATGNERMMIAQSVKGGLDGLSVSTNSIDGRETKITQSITGENITHISRATREFSNNGNFNNDMLYNFSKSGIVKDETLATGVSTITTGLKITGFGKFLLSK